MKTCQGCIHWGSKEYGSLDKKPHRVCSAVKSDDLSEEPFTEGPLWTPPGHSCALFAVHAHTWVRRAESTENTYRYDCVCGASGWKPKFSGEIKEYKNEERPVQIRVNAQPRMYGRNVSGGYLPPGGSK